MGVADPGQFPELVLPSRMRLGSVLPLVELQLLNLFKKQDSECLPRQPLGTRTVQSTRNSGTAGPKAHPPPGQGGGGGSPDIQEGPLTPGATVSPPPRSRSPHHAGHRRSGPPKESGFDH